ncbi:phosphotransferase [Candidatus Dependentiae bacterium]|nr:phosphotransferase [Candidatus Dependentiae bacterium]
MNNTIKLCTITAMLLALCSCETRRIDEKYAASVVKDKLSLPGTVTAQALKGGMSGAKLFTVTDGAKKYVIRFMAHETPERCLEEMRGFRIASENGYGPHIYFMDEKDAVIIMEYISSQPITYQQLQSKELCSMLGHLLKKMHSSQSLQKTTDAINRVRRKLHKITPHGAIIPLESIENNLAIIQKTVTPYIVSAPCHLGLNPDNLIFFGDGLKAIDYESAAQSDPYFDIATVSLFYCFDSNHEEILLRTYLERKPTLKEKARLYLMKQVALINFGSNLLRRIDPKMPFYKTLKIPSYKAFLKEWWLKNVTLNKPESLLKFGRAMFNKAIKNFESQEFKDAIKILRETPPEKKLLPKHS